MLDDKGPESVRSRMGSPTGQASTTPAPTEQRAPQATGPVPTSPGLDALVLALKARDELTWRHSLRVADLAGLLAIELGWPA